MAEAIKDAKWAEDPTPLASLAGVKDEVAEIPPENVAAISLLQSWRNEDAHEQAETWEYLKRALDEDRLSDRKFFT
jgi:hypothetical protein